ncbi:MAG: hypothetical protein QXK88_01555 [Desulfurococcaceae archaeon]
MIDSLMYELIGGVARKPRLVVHVCLSVLFYWLIRLLFGVSWITYWHPLFVIVFLASYVSLLPYLRQRILNALREAAEEGFNIGEVPELLERLGETCFLDDINDRISGKFVIFTIVFWFSYYALLVLVISIVDHYAIYYGGPLVLTPLFDTYAIYTSTFIISSLVVSAYLAYTKYVENEKAHRDVFSEWVEGLIEDYTVNNCFRGGKRGKSSRILMMIAPLTPIPGTELLRPIPVVFLPRSLAEKRLKALGSSRYSIERVGEETTQPANLIPEEKEVTTIEDLEKGILQHVKMAKVYKNEGNKRELLGYLITLTAKLEATNVIVTRRAKGGQFICKTEEPITHIYLLALHPGMAKFYMDLLTMRSRSQLETKKSRP